MTVSNIDTADFAARMKVRTTVQEALQLWMNEAGYKAVLCIWSEFWSASDALVLARRALTDDTVADALSYEVATANFDDVCLRASAAASAFFVELSQRASSGVAKSVAAINACACNR